MSNKTSELLGPWQAPSFYPIVYFDAATSSKNGDLKAVEDEFEEKMRTFLENDKIRAMCIPQRYLNCSPVHFTREKKDQSAKKIVKSPKRVKRASNSEKKKKKTTMRSISRERKQSIPQSEKFNPTELRRSLSACTLVNPEQEISSIPTLRAKSANPRSPKPKVKPRRLEKHANSQLDPINNDSQSIQNTKPIQKRPISGPKSQDSGRKKHLQQLSKPNLNSLRIRKPIGDNFVSSSREGATIYSENRRTRSFRKNSIALQKFDKIPSVPLINTPSCSAGSRGIRSRFVSSQESKRFSGRRKVSDPFSMCSPREYEPYAPNSASNGRKYVRNSKLSNQKRISKLIALPSARSHSLILNRYRDEHRNGSTSVPSSGRNGQRVLEDVSTPRGESAQVGESNSYYPQSAPSNFYHRKRERRPLKTFNTSDYITIKKFGKHGNVKKSELSLDRDSVAKLKWLDTATKRISRKLNVKDFRTSRRYSWRQY